MSRPRCAICGISQESNSFSRLLAGPEEFRFSRGDEVLGDYLPDAHPDIEWVPLLCARGTPFGPVSRAIYEQARDEIRQDLEETAPLDGVLLRLHGAMEVEGIGDGESDLVAAVREVVGDDIPIVASLDLHANMAPSVVAATNVMTAYRRSPHDDARETWHRAVAHAARVLREGIVPRQVLVRLLLLLPGEFAVTYREPAESLYARLLDIERAPGILDASILIGCAWTDGPHTSVSVLVVAEEDPELARPHCEALAEEIWARRREFGPETDLLEPAEAVARAMVSTDQPAFVQDTGDNPGAGAAGDLPIMLDTLLKAGAKQALVASLQDAAAVDACLAAGEGTRLSLELGGKLDTGNSGPLPVDGTVLKLFAPDHALLRCGGVDVLLCRRRSGQAGDAVRLLGADLGGARVVVSKGGYPAGSARTVARSFHWAVTPGWTDLRLERLPYRHLRRPIFPLDEGVEFACQESP
jgi:microcystin degradation protein MlrC